MKNSLVEILANTWKMFAMAFSITTILAALFGQENLLKSDDPYLAGFGAGGVMAIVALIHSAAGHFPKVSRFKNWIFGAVLVAWCGCWIVYEIMYDGEGDGISGMIAGASLVLGLLAWLLCKVPMPRWTVIVATVFAVVLAGLYLNLTLLTSFL